MATAPRELYPFSTPDKQAIPLDIIDPVAVAFKDFTAAFSNLVVDSRFEMAAFIASADCWVDVMNDGTALPADGVIKSNWLFVPKDAITIARTLAWNWRVVNADLDEVAGRLVVQALGPWNGLALKSQYERKN